MLMEVDYDQLIGNLESNDYMYGTYTVNIINCPEVVVNGVCGHLRVYNWDGVLLGEKNILINECWRTFEEMVTIALRK